MLRVRGGITEDVKRCERRCDERAYEIERWMGGGGGGYDLHGEGSRGRVTPFTHTNFIHSRNFEFIRNTGGETVHVEGQFG